LATAPAWLRDAISCATAHGFHMTPPERDPS
jgi:hypothetical protein